MVYYLLSTPEGGPLIGEILTCAEESGDGESVSTEIVNARLEGGASGLGSRWRTWLSAHKAAHYY